MFCPKCGSQNPENGKFCRSCGIDLGNVSSALTSPSPAQTADVARRKRSCEGAIAQLFMGTAFVIVAIILGATGKASGWWFWMLIPAFAMLGSGVSKYMRQKELNASLRAESNSMARNLNASPEQAGLPPSQTSYASVESRYQTGDLVPPSVTDNTTRHLEINKEGETMALPKK